MKLRIILYFCVMEIPNNASFRAQYHQIQEFEKKIEFLQENIRKYVTHDSPYVDFIVELYLTTAELLLQRGWYAECMDAASRVLDFYKDQPDAFRTIQTCNHIKTLYQQAQKYHLEFFYRKEVECYEQILAISQEDTNAWFNLGNAYLLQYEYGKAIESFENVLQIDPSDEQAWFNLAYVYEKYNLPEQAIDAYSQLIEINPNHEKAWLNRGHVYFMTGNLEKAQWDYKNAYSLGEDEALYVLAEIEKQLNSKS